MFKAPLNLGNAKVTPSTYHQKHRFRILALSANKMVVVATFRVLYIQILDNIGTKLLIKTCY